MEIKDYIIGVMVAGLFAFGLLGLMFGSYSEAGINLDPSVSGELQNIQGNSTGMISIFETTTGEIQKNSPGGTEVTQDSTDSTRSDAQLGAAWRALSKIPSTFKYFGLLMQSLAQALHVPVIFVNVALTSLIIIVSMILLSAILSNVIR